MSVRRFGLIAALVLTATAGCAAAPVEPALRPPQVPKGGIAPTTRFTPLAGGTVTTPAPVVGTDGKTHVTYELLLTNATPAPVTVEKVDVLAGGRVVDSLTGPRLAAQSTLLAEQSADPANGDPAAPVTPIPASGVGVVWLDVLFDGAAPDSLAHRVTASIGGGPAVEVDTGTVPVSTAPAPVLGPPLRGGPWYASDGCCVDNTHHRRGLAPIDGRILVPQRYAIDWYLLDDQHRAWVDDPSQITNFLAYDQPAIAVADGVVVDATDGFADTTSLPAPPPVPPIVETVGNHVTLMIAPGRYALYAHFKQGSVAVQTGQQVKQGDVLGHIGSSGNSTAPHLHFQLNTEPTFFPTDSTPFAFDCLRLDGQVTERIWDDVLAEQPTPVLPYQASNDTTEHRDQMPLDRNVVTFC
ncbi:M23 family metallopeptidase [Pseudonocardia sp. WMMC193]|uniref:M23 family metallopeptidase n=1 Tax=Pseudonocardia sp. WMMC193 TaxID=2911965 RepID=UPI001F3D9F43|nr:M23 family metallopeptidase [Pseudonocardia sp. WMMC193]MCF7548109.1 peptidoglycan DD-metalloendopeptidase family protein [Pseudonocardia sp. WMMC193]